MALTCFTSSTLLSVILTQNNMTLWNLSIFQRVIRKVKWTVANWCESSASMASDDEPSRTKHFAHRDLNLRPYGLQPDVCSTEQHVAYLLTAPPQYKKSVYSETFQSVGFNCMPYNAPHLMWMILNQQLSISWDIWVWWVYIPVRSLMTEKTRPTGDRNVDPSYRIISELSRSGMKNNWGVNIMYRMRQIWFWFEDWMIWSFSS